MCGSGLSRILRGPGNTRERISGRVEDARKMVEPERFSGYSEFALARARLNGARLCKKGTLNEKISSSGIVRRNC